MPAIGLHGIISTKLLDAWPNRSAAKLPVDRSDIRNAFRAGASGPDMGFASKADRLISDLAHYVRSADLLRAMLDRAENDIQWAYAWGWLSHLLADAAIHPMVNRMAGELLYDDPRQSISYDENPVAHVRVEMGLDGAYVAAHPPADPLSFAPVFDEVTVRFLADAFAVTYGEQIVRREQLCQAHRRACRASRVIAETSISIGGGRLAVSRWWVPIGLAVVGPLTRVFARESMLYAATHAVMPREELLAEVEAAVEKVVDDFFGHASDSAAALPNYNLDLGVEESIQAYPPREAALAMLAATVK